VTRATSLKNNGVIRTGGELFHDGSALDLFRVPSEPEEMKLLHWNGNALEFAAHIERAGRKYAPPTIEPNLNKALRLPTRVAPPETARKLFTDVQVLLRRHLAQLDSCTTAMVFALFASWLSPVLQMAPIVFIFAPAGSPKDLALQLLSLLSRHPLRLAGLKRADLIRVPMSLQPTLILDEPDLQPATQSLLQAGAHRGWYVPSGGGVRDLFGPKIICSRKPPLGTELGTDVLRVALIPASGRLPILDNKVEEEIAEEFQARFLGYLLRNFSKVQVPHFDVSDLAQPVQELARAFGAAVVGDEELQARILPLLKIKDEEIRSDRASAFDSVVLEAILFFIHQGGWTRVRMDNIADQVSTIFKGRGFQEEPSPERVGWAVKRLGIPSGRINRAGNGIELSVSTSRLVHELALSYGVRAMQGTIRSDCRYCRELGATVGQTKT
jgi:hypothetical protein